MNLTSQHVVYMNSCNRLRWSSSTWKRKSRFDSVLCKTTMSFSATRRARNPLDGAPYAHREESTFNKTCITSWRRTNIHVGYVCIPMLCGRYILQSDFITSLDLHHESKVTIPPPSPLSLRVRSGSDTCKVYLPACLDDSISSYEEGTRRRVEKRWWCGPNVVSLYRKDTIRGDLILAPVWIREDGYTEEWGQK